ncbi:hypothetical protein NLU66_09375 [Brachybacterium sp. NBEC-018]|uniref:LysM peptidoglycan-binding domain-containing protein n=1 Tax=Brachybacterium sp. NBEC-018 TaxID=2996004 RepID=UPI002174FA7F|nr:hypothetical protein [Brachybacterium sp. NBEC-018]UVY82455.1 hypothetical protein NLU66_09375 [Brachybacterium sp. NBEC-018]
MGETQVAEAAPGRTGAVRTGLTAVLAAAGTLAMAAAARTLVEPALTGSGEQALLNGVLLVLAAAGALLCLYLTIVWALATLVLVAGPATALGRTLLGALRLIAPQLARRITVAAALGTAATAMVLGPASAADQGTGFLDLSGVGAGTAQELTAPADPAPSDGGGETGGAAPTEEGELPPLGWESAPSSQEPGTAEDEAPVQHEAPEGDDTSDAAPETSDAPADPTAPAEGASDPADDTDSTDATDSPRAADATTPPRTIVVGAGDSLWTLTDEALGPGADSPQDIASSWPRLYEANRHEIGSDPDQLTPGQVLTVPSALTDEESS